METREWTDKLLNSIWLSVNKEVACKKLVENIKTTDLNNVGEFYVR